MATSGVRAASSATLRRLLMGTSAASPGSDVTSVSSTRCRLQTAVAPAPSMPMVRVALLPVVLLPVLSRPHSRRSCRSWCGPERLD